MRENRFMLVNIDRKKLKSFNIGSGDENVFHVRGQWHITCFKYQKFHKNWWLLSRHNNSAHPFIALTCFWMRVGSGDENVFHVRGHITCFRYQKFHKNWWLLSRHNNSAHPFIALTCFWMRVNYVTGPCT